MAVHVNQTVPEHVSIAAWGAPGVIRPFLRKDILLIANVDYYFSLTESFDYAIIDSRSQRIQPPLYQDAPILFSIERDGVTLAELKFVKGMQP